MMAEADMATTQSCETTSIAAVHEVGDTLDTEQWVKVAQSRSSVYGFLAALYNQLPDVQFAQGVVSAEFHAFVESVQQSQDQPDGVRAGARLIAQFAREMKDAVPEDLRTQLRVERTRLFRGVKPGYGPLPPYESVYANRDAEVDAHSVATIAGIYAHCGAALPDERREQPDYIGLELDFMRHLCAKEAQAWLASDVQAAQIALDVQNQFLTEHVGVWMPAYCDEMYADAQLALYQGLALFTKGFVEDEVTKVALLQELVVAP